MKLSATAGIFLFASLLSTAHCETFEEVDFVIVGGGTAGCALAGRLCAALPDSKIVLIERGVPRNGETEFLVRTPRNSMTTRTVSSLSEVYQSEPEPGLLGKPQTIITGNTLGGSSSINGMQWMVPVDNSIDRWKIGGLSSANWRRYLRRAYRAVGFSEPPEDLQQIYTRDYIEAAKRLGLREDRRQFASNVRSAMWTIRRAATPDGRRTDACTAYVSPVLDTTCKQNLRILQSATVTRILLSHASPPRAYGVEYVVSTAKESKRREMRARKEVLLTAGPFESPKLLQLSGIGPWKVLQRAGIKVKVDLPVGTRTRSRVRNIVASAYTGVPEEPSGDLEIVNSPEAIRQWRAGEGGVLGVSSGCVNGVLRRSSYFSVTFQRSEPGPDGKPLLLSVCLPNSRSFGYLRIKDGNPFSTPLVKFNALRTSADIRKLQLCMRRLIRLHTQFKPPFQLTQVLPPTANVTESFLRSTSAYTFHFVGGCRVGSVVRRSLRVRGVEGLRVIDSSVFRTLPVSAGPMAATYVLAEFMAEKLARIHGS